MSEIQKIDDKKFKKIDTIETDYDVDDLTTQINMLNERAAQIISNYQDQTTTAVQPSLDQIAVIQQLLADAAAAGVTPDSPPDQSLDVTPILDSISSLKSNAGQIASASVVEAPVETAPSEVPLA